MVKVGIEKNRGKKKKGRISQKFQTKPGRLPGEVGNPRKCEVVGI